MKIIDIKLEVSFKVPDNIENIDKAQTFIEDDGKLVLWVDGERFEHGVVHDVEVISELCPAEVVSREFEEAKDTLNEYQGSLPYDPAKYFRRAT